MRGVSICQKTGLRRGAWTEEEDGLLSAYIKRYGHWNWRELPKYAGLSRCGKSCRLRWMNYLRPDIKRGNFTTEEDEIITNHIKKFGYRWSAIATNLPGRTDNEVKNYWHTTLKKQTEPSTVLTGSKRVKPLKSKRPSVQGNAFHPVILNSIVLESSEVVPLPHQSCSDSSVWSSDSQAVIIENQAMKENEVWLDTDLYSPEEISSEHIQEDAQQKSSASSVSSSDPEVVISELPVDTEKDFHEEFSTEPFLLEDAHFWDNNSPIWIDSSLTHPYSPIDPASYAYDLCYDYNMDFLFSH